jgi:addiction module HigA family antidote
MPLTAIHPGEHLSEELAELGMSAAELARRLEVPINHITEILKGRRSVTGDTALRLAHFLGTTAELWLNLQSPYEIQIARQKDAAPCVLPFDGEDMATVVGRVRCKLCGTRWSGQGDRGFAQAQASRTDARVDPR